MEEATKTFYVLDVMSWRAHDVFDTELDFRTFWMHSKFSEEPSVAIRQKANPYAFMPLYYNACTPGTRETQSVCIYVDAKIHRTIDRYDSLFTDADISIYICLFRSVQDLYL